ncbi:hypothetical protein LJB86_01505 [Deltaproteobacteria bacterium OttesenSCG-928-M10]|nr:hypothetical protein [Deltaproteobacteria bacterium OttesenSCG-928-M10]
MVMEIGILCTSEALELAALVGAVQTGRVPAEIKIVIADRDSDALRLAREAGLYGAFVPRSAFHANRDGFERRLAELFREAGAKAVVLAGYEREVGSVLKDAFPERLFGQGLAADELIGDLEKRWRAGLFGVVG